MGKAVRVVLLLMVLGGIVGGYASRYLGLGRRHHSSSRATQAATTASTDVGAPGDRFRVPVERVIDGDTIIVRLDGRRERVRYIGINTPETHHPHMAVQPYGPEATEANRGLVAGGDVVLELDAEPRDKYGRLLAYVYLPDGTFVNAVLVEEGYAQVMTVPPNVRHADEFRRLEREARAADRGLWSQK